MTVAPGSLLVVDRNAIFNAVGRDGRHQRRLLRQLRLHRGGVHVAVRQEPRPPEPCAVLTIADLSYRLGRKNLRRDMALCPGARPVGQGEGVAPRGGWVSVARL